MSPTLYVPLILAGIVILLVGGDFLVRGGAALARRWNLPPLLVGLTIIAFGTSAPELVVSIQSAINGAPGLALGNIVGSNTANFLLVLGLPALFGPIITTVPGVRRNALIALAAAGALIWVSWDRVITPTEGALLFAAIIGYVALLGMLAMGKNTADDPTIAELTDVDGMDGLPKTMSSVLIFLVLGLVALPGGAHMIVQGGIAAATDLGVDQSLIGLTALAFGTSLPELATVVMASMRRHAEMAIGNVIGSNIFNVFAVGGAAAMAGGAVNVTLNVPEAFFALDFWVMLGSSVVIALVVLAKRPIGRVLGSLLFISYIGYIAYLAQTMIHH
jgi:cation:H+ antiporter